MQKSKSFYPPENFTCTEPTDIKQTFAPYTELLKSAVDVHLNMYTEDDEERKKRIFQLMDMDISDGEKNWLTNFCNADALTIEDEVEPTSNVRLNFNTNLVPVTFDITDSARELKIIQCKEKWKNKFGRIQGYACPQRVTTAVKDMDLLPFSHIVVVVKVYTPFKYSRNSSYLRLDRLKCSHEVAVLGTQTLSALRDKILCANDLGFTVPVENPNETTLNPDVKEEYPSGFLYIENCFYKDMRSPKCFDYSEIIRKWAEGKKFGPFTTGDMETTRVVDLKIRFGYPYLYQHQGDCEHIIVFADTRLLRPHEPLSTKNYPYFQHEHRYMSVMCFICRGRISTFVVTESTRLPHKYTYFCTDCLLSYNYVNGKKIGEFKLYPFYDKASVLINC